MKLGPVTKHEKRGNRTSKEFDDNVMHENCNVIGVFPIYDQFGVIWKTDSGRIFCKTYIFIKSFRNLCIKTQSASVFLDVAKYTDFW